MRHAPVGAATLIRGMFHQVSNNPQPGMGVFPADWLDTRFLPVAVRKVTTAQALRDFSMQYGEPKGDTGLRRALSQKLGALNVQAGPPVTASRPAAPTARRRRRRRSGRCLRACGMGEMSSPFSNPGQVFA